MELQPLLVIITIAWVQAASLGLILNTVGLLLLHYQVKRLQPSPRDRTPARTPLNNHAHFAQPPGRRCW